MGENGGDAPDPQEIQEAVQEWRDWVNDEVDLLEEPLEWPEGRDLPYFTARPTSLGLGALQLWAAYTEHPGHERPTELPAEWLEDPVLGLSLADDFPCRYPHLLFGVDVWLPVRVAEVFDAAHPLDEDEQIRFGSVSALIEELEDLNLRTWQADRQTLERWRAGGLEAEGDLEGQARYSFAVFLAMARKAEELGMPMVLD